MEEQLDALSLIPAQELPLAQLAAVVTRAYADYYYHVAVTEAQLAQICFEQDVDLSQSVVALHAGEPVGAALLSRRETRGWISAVGVLPGWRRKGIARAMLRYLQQRVRELGLRSATLEVLAENRPGLALYASLGFQRRRDLAILILEPQTFVPDPLTLTRVAPASPASLLAHFEAWHPVPPSWQRELRTLRHRLSYLSGLGYWEDDLLLGYALFQSQSSYQLVHDLAVTPEAARPLEIAGELLRAVHEQHPASGGYVINAVMTDPLLPAYLALHYRLIQRQYELIWEPDAGG